jgi:hypothetical protein
LILASSISAAFSLLSNMHLRPFTAGIVSLLCSQATAAPSAGINARSPLDDFVSKESAVSLQGALNNIGPNGSEVPGAGAGFVVASPSKVDPDCKSGLNQYFSSIAGIDLTGLN